MLYACAGAVLTFAVALTGCSTGGPDNRPNAGGSTFVYPMMSKWAAEYNKVKKVEVNYQSIGSGGGLAQMTAKTFDFGCSELPMSEEQLRAARQTGGEVIHVPVAFYAVVPVYNLKEAREPLRFTGPVLADIYLGKIRKWNDPALRQLNPGVPLPETDILPLHRADRNSLTYQWTDYLAKVSPEWRSQVGVGLAVAWPAGQGQPG